MPPRSSCISTLSNVEILGNRIPGIRSAIFMIQCQRRPSLTSCPCKSLSSSPLQAYAFGMERSALQKISRTMIQTSPSLDPHQLQQCPPTLSSRVAFCFALCSVMSICFSVGAGGLGSSWHHYAILRIPPCLSYVAGISKTHLSHAAVVTI